MKIKKDINKSLTKGESSQKFEIRSLRLLLPYIKQFSKSGIAASVFLLFTSILSLPAPYIMKYIVDDVIVKKDLSRLNLLIFVLILIHLFKFAFSFFTNYFFSIFSQSVLVNIKKKLFSKVLRFPLSFFDSQQSGYLHSRLGEVDGLGYFFSNSMMRIILGIFEFFFCLWILIFLNWELALISLSILPFLYLPTRLFSRSIRNSSLDVMEKGAIISKKIHETFSGVEVVKSFSTEKRETNKIHTFLEKLKQSVLRKNRKYIISSEILSLVGIMGGIIVLWYGGWKIIEGSFTIGSYIAFSAYLAKLYSPTQILANTGLALQPAITALNRISELFELAEEKSGGLHLHKLKGKIEFKNIYFSYEEKKEEVLKNISFKINPGEKILIIGPNGSGKSTIVKLILGLYKAKRGKIFVDDYDIDALSKNFIRERISIVSQNIFLFNDSIKNNILYSKHNASADKLEEVTKLAGVYDFIVNLKDGFDTEIGETGKKLSGGERKKIAVARAIIKDSDIIVFDEATSEIDNDSVKKIENLLKEMYKNKTCIIISHRRWGINGIDKIYNLYDGKIFEYRQEKEKRNKINIACDDSFVIRS